MSPDALMGKARDILEQARKAIKDVAKSNPDEWWYVNRFVFARLNLDERSTKTEIKKNLFASGAPCHACEKKFESRHNVHLHRLDQSKGYSAKNCVLMHAECHTKWHAEGERESGGRPRKPRERANEPTLVKVSQRYENQKFTYWWDIAPRLAERLHQYENVEFVKKNTHERCVVPVGQLKVYLTPDRQTSRGTGHWGIKVLGDRPDELGFEPAKRGQPWHFLSVTWLDEEKED